jgi:membrane protein YdbS with pleckstrin-like domain
MMRNDLRNEPTWRIPFGVLMLCVVLAIYGLLVARLIGPLIQNWPTLGQLPVYIVMGVLWLWLMPLKRFLKWMETGNWS